ncbi:uncharacterized protein LOC122860101 [Aphidius gifuensis]|uniref:uncharacterized protein LOC122860101 n=1 Tax=Aphidius gifuensis TaxID=684658 RepID=UPI001CDCAB3E|nr:uncharacterized protein LOC122860101 [Aphidius gifuensis]
MLRHWDVVLKADNPNGYNLKVCPGLSHDVIHPKPFQKMNVRRAFRFFSIAAGMELFKTEGVPGLQDADPSKEIIKIINNVIRIMNSKSPGESLKWDSDDRKELENFLNYLDE